MASVSPVTNTAQILMRSARGGPIHMADEVSRYLIAIVSATLPHSGITLELRPARHLASRPHGLRSGRDE